VLKIKKVSLKKTLSVKLVMIIKARRTVSQKK